MLILKICNKVIEYSFYAIFLLVPFVLSSQTSELFELNKMWVTWGLAIVIAGAWFIKMVIQKKVFIQKTPLDIPILLFLSSQIIATLFSWDFHVSFWGYYSRFNGGLLSILSYVFLYYAFVTNLLPNGIQIVKRVLIVSLISGFIVALWGLPSHFGYDPTCFLFRGNLDVSCWTDDFQPKVRIFSTLGQPNWMAAYLAILLPISIIMFIKFIKNLPLSTFYFLLSALFYMDLLYTRSRSGVLAAWISLAFFFSMYILTQRKNLNFSFLNSLASRRSGHFSFIIGLFLLITFIIGTPFNQLHKFTLPGIKSSLSKPAVNKSSTAAKPEVKLQEKQGGDAGGTESGSIRNNVWPGAINIWKQYPIFGTGVETFAFSYYKYKPIGQNLVSEWNFLYNKAHNEFLNYLATTGIFGLGTYLLMIGWFIFLSLRPVMLNLFQHLNQTGSRNKFGMTNENTLVLALIASYISILVTNFFGFSVVITNIYLFMIPAFVLVLIGAIKNNSQNDSKKENQSISLMQWTVIIVLLFTICYLLFTLIKFWFADKNYAYGQNLNRAGEHLQAYQYLQKAVGLRNEPVFRDEFAINNATLAVTYVNQKDLAKATAHAQEAINISDRLIEEHQNNILFWKTRVKIFYTLSQVDVRYLPEALNAIQKATDLAPNDASIQYNLGVLYGQNNNIEKGIDTLENTVKLKPDYKDAHYALGLFYHQAAIDDKGNVINPQMQEKAVAQMQYILTNLSPSDTSILDALKSWGAE